MTFMLNPYMQPPPGTPLFVGGTSVGFINGGGGTVSLTSLTGGVSSAPAEGDLIIVAAATGSTALSSVTISGYTQIASLSSDDNFDLVLRVAYLFAGPSPPTGISLTGTGNVANAAGVVVHVWRNINEVTPLDVTATTATGIDTPNAVPPAITPVTPGAIILAIGGGAGGTLAAYTGPSMTDGREHFFTGWGADTQDGLAGIYAKTDWASGEYTPPAFSGGAGALTSAWAACTVALRPA